MLSKRTYFTPELSAIHTDVQLILNAHQRQKILTDETYNSMKELRYHGFLKSCIERADKYNLKIDQFYKLENLNLTDQVFHGLSEKTKKSIMEYFKLGYIPYSVLLHIKKSNINYVISGLASLVYNFRIQKSPDIKVLRIKI